MDKGRLLGVMTLLAMTGCLVIGSTPTMENPVIRMHVRSTPDGALVYVGDVLLAETPGQFDLPLGRHSVELRRDGYKTYRCDVRSHAMKVLVLNVRLAREDEPGESIAQ